MGIVNGWLDWAIRLPGPISHTNSGSNSVKGVFMHSAEGYAGTLLDPNSPYGYNGNHSWHLSNLMDGRVFQHYPFTARCWHATAANQEYIGVENEGDAPREPSLNQLQVANARRFIAELSNWKGWQPRRPAFNGDINYTLWEHNEVVKIGGTPSLCPSGRIPWDLILAEEDMTPPEHYEGELNEHRAILAAVDNILNGVWRVDIIDGAYRFDTPDGLVYINGPIPDWAVPT